MSLKDIRSLDYTVLLCRDLPATRAFYEHVMGFPVEQDLGTWVSFRIGATLLTLRPRGRGPAWQDGPHEPGSASVQLAFRVPPPAVDACHAELLAAGVPILRGPTDLPDWRHRTLFFRDPEDNIIEIYAEY
ncbi:MULTISPECIES: VOC family protein [unclassified Nocardiopsis]|uniref:VOC family protein n=1 Tax=Nocardiopsis TaxID=2013 RepID=UPI00387B71D2